MKLVWVKGKGHLNTGQHGTGLCFALSTAINLYKSVPTGRVIFEIGGAPVREELARDGTYLLLILDAG